MDNSIKRRIEFGKVDYTEKGRKAYPVSVDVELRERGGKQTYRYINGEKVPTVETTPRYYELSICGYIWNARRTDCVCGGQCLDTIREYRAQLNNIKLFDEVYRLWTRYNLNGMRAGTPEQEKALAEWKAAGNKYDYTVACEYLKRRGLYEVMYTGKSCGREYKNEPYKYGHAWLVEDLPAPVVERVRAIIAGEN